jgi:hypothetical protein
MEGLVHPGGQGTFDPGRTKKAPSPASRQAAILFYDESTKFLMSFLGMD